MSPEEKKRLVNDFLHRSLMHHSMWFTEVKHNLGEKRAYKMLGPVWDNISSLQAKRLSGVLDFEFKGNISDILDAVTNEKLDDLLRVIAVNWLAADGLWFLAVEESMGMFEAKRINDSCWAQFSPFEAWSVKRFLELGENSGLEGLKKALPYRMYAFINKQEIVEQHSGELIIYNNECRVQNARKRKGLEDYACKSAGLVEYREFARVIDNRTETQCICCPPDEHPEEWYCSWKFVI